MLQRVNNGDGGDFVSTLCKYDVRKGDLFILSWASVRRVRWGSIFSELLMCGGGVRSILLLPLVPRDNRCMYMAQVRFYVCCIDCMGAYWNVGCVAAAVKESVFLDLESWSMLYVCVRGGMDVVFSVCIVTRGAVGARVWEV